MPLGEQTLYLSFRARRGGWQNCPPGFLEGRLQPVRETGRWHPLGGSPEGQSSPEKLDTLQEGNHKRARAGCPHGLKDELLWKKTSLSEERAAARAQEEKEGCDLWKIGG